MSISENCLGQRKCITLIGVLLCAMLAGCASNRSEPPKTGDDIVDKYIATNIRLGVLYLQKRKFKFAKEKADKVLAADPKNSHGNNLMALIYWRLQEHDKADRYFRLAIGYDHKNSRALNNYGVFLCERGKTGKAVRYLKRAAEEPLYEGRAQALANAGQCLIDAKQYKKAEEFLQQALAIDPKSPPALYQIARLSYHHRRIVMAHSYMKRYLSTGAKSPGSLLLAVRIANKRGDYRQAKYYARLLQSKFPESVEASRIRIR